MVVVVSMMIGSGGGGGGVHGTTLEQAGVILYHCVAPGPGLDWG